MDIERQPAVFHSRMCSALAEQLSQESNPEGVNPSLKALKLLRPQFAASRVSSFLIISITDVKVIFPQHWVCHITSWPEMPLCP